MLFNCKPADDIDNRHIELSIEPDTELVIDEAFDIIKDSTIDGKMVGCRTNKKPNLVLGKVIIENASIMNKPEIQLLSGMPMMNYDELESDTKTEIRGKVVDE